MLPVCMLLVLRYGATFFVGLAPTPELGFEPRKAGLEAAVLPLHHSGILVAVVGIAPTPFKL
jgi:hypothetical protein